MGFRGFLTKPSDKTVFLVIGLIVSIMVALGYFYRPWFLSVMDLKATDAMFAARGVISPPEDVVIVAIDEQSVNELGRWPWTRSRTAALVDALKDAKVIAFDMVFSENEGPSPDKALSESIGRSGNVILGYFFRDDATEEPPQASLIQLKRSSVSLIRFVAGAQGATPGEIPVTEFYGLETNIPAVGKGAAGFGSFNAIPQQDGIYRASNLLFRYKSEIYPSLAIAALEDYLEGTVVLTAAPYGIDGLSIGTRTIPVNEVGELSVNFYGPGGTFKTYPAVDVIKGRVKKGAFKDKLVFIGVTEKAVYDIRPTPIDSLFPGVEIHATIAGNVLQERYLIHDTRVVIYDLLLVFLLPAALSMILAGTHRTYISIFAMLVFLALLVTFDLYLFSAYSVKTGVMFPAIAIVLAYMLEEAYRNVVVEKKSRYIKKAFSTYVSPQLVTELLKDPGRLKLGGEKRVISVLFSDIRGFTTLSEKLPPEALVALLNEYLSPMTGIVLSEEGMLDKYIGDAIMAVFNAPLTIPDHAKRACSAALKMIERLKSLNEAWKAGGYPELAIGVGINTGEAVVGNMGAELRFDYTAIGDTVNLASRLEGMNKMYGTFVVVSEYTYEDAKDAFLFRELDYVRVKGKAKPITMYELIGPDTRDEKALKFCGSFAAALGLYREQRFGEAMEAFKAMLKEYPGDGPSGLYVKRCVEYIEASPPEDWDGVFVAKTK